MILTTLGILGEYIWRALDASRNRPVFIVDEKNFNYNTSSKENEDS